MAIAPNQEIGLWNGRQHSPIGRRALENSLIARAMRAMPCGASSNSGDKSRGLTCFVIHLHREHLKSKDIEEAHKEVHPNDLLRVATSAFGRGLSWALNS